jgi:hypothetical protein
MNWFVGLVGAIAIPFLSGWLVVNHGGMRTLRRIARPFASYYDDNGEFVDPLKEWRERRAT